MNRITKTGIAGTVESNDVMITLSPAEPGTGINISLTSPVLKQYGKIIETVVVDELKNYGVTDVSIIVNDRGALDCTIRARVQTALTRAMG